MRRRYLLEDEINHFKHIRVTLEDVSELRRKVDSVRHYAPPAEQIAALRERRKAGEIDDDAYDAARLELERVQPNEIFDHNGQRLHIKHLTTHYFLPLLISDADKLDYINHVIRTPSDEGVVHLMDDRFAQAQVRALLPTWWRVD